MFGGCLLLLRFRNKRVLTSLSRRRDKKVEWKTGGEGGGGGGVERGGGGRGYKK